MIYEFVVYSPNALRPRQVGRRSNKFTNGERLISNSNRDAAQRNRRPEEEHPEIDALSLSLVCKEMNRDLQRRPVFYQVNRFHFTEIGHLEVYLAAITPRRREAIRYLSIYDETIWLAWKSFFCQKSLLALLTECKSIKDLSLTIGVNGNSIGLLRWWVDGFVSEADGTPCFWSLPFVRLLVHFMEERGQLKDGSIDLGRLDEIPAVAWPASFPRGNKSREYIETLNDYSKLALRPTSLFLSRTTILQNTTSNC